MKYKFYLLATGVFMVVLISCNRNLVFEKYTSIPETKWHKDSLVNFSVQITDTVSSKNLLINIRNDITYKYSNLWLFIEMVYPGGEMVKDTFGLTLANPAGKWLGEGFGKRRTRQVIYKRNVTFSEPGEFKVKIQHGMRDVILEDITDVGFKVEKAE
jgi:gliding motility-associated lipoprotein GldH